MKVREVIRLIEKDGWLLISEEGSHRQYKHAVKTGRVTVAGHPNVDVPIGTLKNIYRQAQMKEKKR
jgi:predicted RNA binding protein YcfA (HicA-like mRNA interferase family)